MSAFFAAALIALSAWSAHPALATRVPRADDVSVARVVAPAVPQQVGRSDGVEELGPVLTAQSAVVVDGASGVVLWGKRPYAVRPIASITKLLTALTLLERAPDWNALVEIIADDLPAEGNTILRAGDRATVAELFRAMLIRSDNGAARALARQLRATLGGGAERDVAVVAAMEQRARSLGLTTLRVFDPTGLDPKNRGTAIDAARLLAAALRSDAVATSLRTMRTTLDAHRDGRRALDVWTTNELLMDGRAHAFTVVGAKTGYLDEAGYNVVMSAERDGHAIIVAVLGSATHEDRFRDAAVLADWTFQNFAWPAR